MKQSRFGAWVLFGLLTVAGILNLVDRQIISVLKPEISQELNWTADDYGTLGAWFQGAMAVGLLISGPLVDRIGVRWANALGVFAWSLSAVFHGFARTLGQFTICRVALGATESMGTPTMIKTVATILPANLRSAGFGIINAVNSLGAVAAPILIPLIAIPFGWRGTFVAAGIAGVVWTALWLLVTRKGLPVAEPAAEAPPVAETTGPAPSILKDRATWAIAGAKVLSDATWWLMLFWMPDFLNRQFGLSGVHIGPPIALAYAGAALGALVSGTVATRLLARGVSVDRARKGAMLVSGLMVLVLPLALLAKTPWEAAAVLAIVLAAHQGFSTNLFALIADVTAPAKIGRVTSVGAFCGNIGGMLIVKAAGLILTAGLGYSPLFLFAGASYLLALGWIQLWLPRIESRGGQAPVQVGH